LLNPLKPSDFFTYGQV